MRYRFYPDERIFHLDLNDAVSAQSALETAMPLLKARPELWSWDWIIDARVVPTDATIDQIARLETIFQRPGRTAVTAFATEDRFLHLWARVMDFQFPGRQHVVVRSAVAALQLIRQRRPKEI